MARTETAEHGAHTAESSQDNVTPFASVLGRLLALLVAFQVVALALVVTAEMVPDYRVAGALLTGIDEGLITTTEHPTTGLGNRVDRWTECIALTIGLGDPPGSTRFETAITNPQLGKCELSVAALQAYRDGVPLETPFDYFRYWHGHTVVTRPSLALLGVAGTRMLAWTLMLGSVMLLATVVGRRVSLTAALLLVVPAALSTDLVDFAESVPHALSMTATSLAAAGVWMVVSRRTDLPTIAAAGLVAGSVSAFVDLMVLFPGAWALVVTLTIVAAHLAGWRRMRLFKAALTAGASWIAGLAFTWMAKWVIAGFTIGFGTMISSVRNQIQIRVRGGHELVASTFGEAIRLNVGYWLLRPMGRLVVGAGLVLAVWLVIRGLRRKTLDHPSLWMVTGASLIPLVWFELLPNHTQIHFWITYKSLGLAMGAGLFGLFALSRPGSARIDAAQPHAGT